MGISRARRWNRTKYAYDAAGNISEITYPSGRTVTYARNTAGEVTQVSSDMSSVTKTIVSTANYLPFGPLDSLTYGNSVTFDYNYGLDYRITSFGSTGIADKQYSYDAAANIDTVADALATHLTRNFEYDDLHRLTSETLPLDDYSAKILPHSPVAYWRLGETSGTTAYDSSGNGYDMSYNDIYLLGEPSLTGDGDTSLRIPTEGAGYAGTATLTGISVTGVETWFQTDSTYSHREIVSLSDSSIPKFTITHKRSGGYVIVAGGQYGSQIMASDAPVSSNEPHHVAVWYESSANTTYMMIDGVIQQATYGADAFNFADPTVYIGAFKNGAYAYKRYHGEIDEVAIYDGAMSASTFANRLSAPGAFAYDANGNRMSHNDGTTTSTLTYQSLSNELATIDSVSVSHDAAGNRTAEPGGLRTYGYSNSGRLNTVTDNSVLTATYIHNAFGQRVKKTVGSTDTVAIYDLGGNLIAEHDGSSNFVRDYVWMNAVPVAQIDSGETFSYLHTDHLGTPRLATNDSQTVVWKWESDAFGEGFPDEDPDGNSTSTTVNLRFPGQYFDSETGLHYNYFRTYDPSTGRYLESDPIGLAAGLNTYSYVSNMPTMRTDRYGLYEGGGVSEVMPGYSYDTLRYYPYPGMGTWSPGVYDYWKEVFGGTYDMLEGFADMYDAGTIGADQYFHCRANCEAARRGPAGEAVSCSISNAREELWRDPAAARAADEAANLQGRRGGMIDRDKSCYEVCSNLIPPHGIPPRHLPPYASPHHKYSPPPP